MFLRLSLITAQGWGPSGNRSSDSRRPGSWAVNANNELSSHPNTAAQTLQRSYDANGSQVQVRNLADPNTTHTDNQTHQYDESNRLVRVLDAAGRETARYEHDPFGRRISKTLTARDAAGAATGTSTTWFIYNEEGLIAEAATDGTPTTAYGWKSGNTWSTDPVFKRDITTAGASQTSATHHYLNDHLGTPQKLVDSAGTTVWAARADAFGETQVQPGATVVNNLRFPGQYFDAETGRHQNYFRDYQAQVGRYTRRDPVGLQAGPNEFIYADGRPLKFADPLGLTANDFAWSITEGGFTGHALILGGSATGGVVINLKTGEACQFVMFCARPGVGILASVGGKQSVQMGPRCGKDLTGWNVQSAGDVATPAGGPGVSLGLQRGGFNSLGFAVGPNYGLGFSIGIDFCWMQVASRACKFSPKDCECR